MAEIDNDQALLDSLEGEFGESEYDLGNDEEEALLAEDDATEDVLDLEVQPEDILEGTAGSERCNTSKLDVGSLSDAEESERHSDRFKTERITVVRPSRTIPDSLDQVRTNEDKRPFTNQNKLRNNRFHNAGGQQAKNYQNGQRRNFGEFRQHRTGFRNNQQGGGVTQGVRIRTDVRTVLINPHFKGQVKVKDNSRLAWDNQRRGPNQRVVTESQWTNNNFQYSNNSQPQPQPQVWIVPPQQQQQQQPAPFQQIPRPFQPGPAPFQQQPPPPFVNQPPQFNQPQPCFPNQPYPVNNNSFTQPQFPNQQYSVLPPNNFTSAPNNFTSPPNNFAPPPNNYAPPPTNYNPAPNFNNVLPNNFNHAPLPSNFVPPQNNFTAPPLNDFNPPPVYQNYGQPPQQPQQRIQQQPQQRIQQQPQQRIQQQPQQRIQQQPQRNRNIGKSSIKHRLGSSEVQVVKKRPLTSSNNLEVIPTAGNQTTVKKEDVEEDEAIKAYRLEIEAQKRKREEFLKLKEARRLEAVKQEQQPNPIPVANRIQVPRPSQIQVLTRGPQIRRPLLHNQTNQNSVLRQVTLTNDEDQPPKLSSDFLSSRQVIDKDRELPDTSIVVVSNLATGTTQIKLRKMCQGVGDIQTLQASAKERQATIAFKSVASAHAFYKKYNHTMLDLSMIQVKLLPKAQTE